MDASKHKSDEFGWHIDRERTVPHAYLATLLQGHEVISSSTLIERLVSARELSRENAKQILSRHAQQNGLWRSECLKLPGGERLYALAKNRGQLVFVDRILDLLAEHRPGIRRCALALRQHEILLRDDARRLLATPSGIQKRFPSYEAEAAALVEIGVAVIEGEDGPFERLVVRDLSGSARAKMAARRAQVRLMIEAQLSRVLVNFYQRINLVSWNAEAVSKHSDSMVEFNRCVFSASGFSWLSPLMRPAEGRDRLVPAPTLFDVYARDIFHEDVAGFAERLARVSRTRKGAMKVLGVIAAQQFHPAAWKEAKRLGFITINLREFFSDAALMALANVEKLLNQVVTNATEFSPSDVENLAIQIDELKRNPFVVDLRSIGFETYAALMLRTSGYDDVVLGAKIPFTDARGRNVEREIDAQGWRTGRTELKIIECKAESADKELDPADVNKFFTESVPAFLKEKCAGAAMPRHCEAQIWTTGRIGREADLALQEIKTKPFIEKKLLGMDKLRAELPPTLQSAKRLLAAIAGVGLLEGAK